MSPLAPETLAALLRIRLGESVLSEVLQQLVDVGKSAVTGADEVSITLVREDRPWTATYTGQLALDADELQYERGYGPCIDAGVTGTLLRIDDMRVETRWPDYASKVVARGVLSSLSAPLPLQTEVVGALNCYSRQASAFDDASTDVAVEVTGYIAVAVVNAMGYIQASDLAHHMQAAMASRAVIEQAKGIVMAQNRCDAETAFSILRRASQGRNVKIRDLASVLVERIADGARDNRPR